MPFSRITVDAGQMDGVPCIRGLRIPVATVVGMLAEGMSATEILDALPALERDDVSEALRCERQFTLADCLSRISVRVRRRAWKS